MSMDIELNGGPCEACGQEYEHLATCPRRLRGALRRSELPTTQLPRARRGTMAKRGQKSVCAVCGDPITLGRYGDFTAAGECTKRYLAWGHDGDGFDDRGRDKPVSHWAHPEGGRKDGELL